MFLVMITSKLQSKDNKDLKIDTYHKANNLFKAINIKYQLEFHMFHIEFHMFKINNKNTKVTDHWGVYCEL